MFLRRRVTALSAGAAVLLAACVAAPARADDHPPLFTFNGVRGSGQSVHYSGQYAIWDSGAGAYRAASDEVALTIQYTDTDVPGQLARLTTTSTDAAGNFSFDELIPGQLTLFASDGELSFNDLGPASTSVPVTVPAVATVPTFFDGAEAFSVKSPRSKSQKPPIQVDGTPVQLAATDVATGEQFEEVLLEPVTVQWKIGKQWKTARVVNSTSDDSGFNTVFKKVKSKTWRAVIKAAHGHAGATSAPFKTAPRRSEN